MQYPGLNPAPVQQDAAPAFSKFETVLKLLSWPAWVQTPNLPTSSSQNPEIIGLCHWTDQLLDI